MYSSIKQQISTIQKPQLLLHQPNMFVFINDPYVITTKYLKRII